MAPPDGQHCRFVSPSLSTFPRESLRRGGQELSEIKQTLQGGKCWFENSKPHSPAGIVLRKSRNKLGESNCCVLNLLASVRCQSLTWGTVLASNPAAVIGQKQPGKERVYSPFTACGPSFREVGAGTWSREPAYWLILVTFTAAFLRQPRATYSEVTLSTGWALPL